jgi:aminoglycoside N3'-acetyltransferase
MKKLISKIYPYVFYINYKIKKYLKKDKYIYNKDFILERLFEDLEIPHDSTIYIHAGLKPIKQISNIGYSELVDSIIRILKDKYTPKALMSPAFTPSFRKNKLFSVNYSKSEVGIFSEIFRTKADYRTPDPVFSSSIISSKNNKDFENYDYTDSFSENGLFSNLKNDAYILNIATDHFVSTYFHYLEVNLNLPYRKVIITNGILFDNLNQPINVNHKNYDDVHRASINRNKINSLFLRENIIKYNYYMGLSISLIKVSDMDKCLRNKIKDDPYFMVTL